MSLFRLSGDQPAHNDKDPALTRDAHGTLWVAWQSYLPQADRILARSLTSREPGELIEVSDQGSVNFQPAIACAADGVVWVVWSAMRDGRWQILARPIAGGQRGAVTVLDQSSTLASFPAAAAGPGGRVWAAWTAIHDAAASAIRVAI